MRKFLCVCLIILLFVSTQSAVLAASPEIENKEIDVTAKYQSSTETPAVYSVDISWSSMTFTYTESNTKNWNSTNHSYGTESLGVWDKTAATVTITNHSNVSVEVSTVYTSAGETGITGALTNPTAELAAGAVGNYDGADSHTATLTISGTPNNTVPADGVKIGTVKVTIE